MNEKNLSAAILELRTKSGMTQTEFAIRLDVKGGLGAISKFERGNGRPSPKTLNKMAELADSVGAGEIAQLFRKVIEEKIGAAPVSGRDNPRIKHLIHALIAAANREDEQIIKRVESALRKYTEESEDKYKKNLGTGENSSTIGNARKKQLA